MVIPLLDTSLLFVSFKKGGKMKIFTSFNKGNQAFRPPSDGRLRREWTPFHSFHFLYKYLPKKVMVATPFHFYALQFCPSKWAVKVRSSMQVLPFQHLKKNKIKGDKLSNMISDWEKKHTMNITFFQEV